jgi:hypothetical protein
MRVLIIPLVFLLASCSNMRLARDLREACIGSDGCPVDLAYQAPLSILRANGDTLTVECEATDRQLDDAYRASCRKKLEGLAEQLSQKGNGYFSPISPPDISQWEFHGCIETLTGDIDVYGVKASFPLRWRGD